MVTNRVNFMYSINIVSTPFSGTAVKKLTIFNETNFGGAKHPKIILT